MDEHHRFVLVTSGAGPSREPFVGADLSLAVDGVAVSSTTTVDGGAASFSVPMTVEGPHTDKVSFAGDATHKRAQRSAKFIVTPRSPSPTPPPEGLPEAPFIYIAEAPAPGLVYLEWTVPADGGSQILAYRVYRGDRSGSETFLFTEGASVFSADDVNVTAGSIYYYVVTAFNANGESVWSNEVVVTAL